MGFRILGLRCKVYFARGFRIQGLRVLAYRIMRLYD